MRKIDSKGAELDGTVEKFAARLEDAEKRLAAERDLRYTEIFTYFSDHYRQEMIERISKYSLRTGWSASSSQQAIS